MKKVSNMSDLLVGVMLREMRESRGLSIDQVADVTNIRPGLIKAFEDSDYSKHPPKGYSTGMLSSYARALGMDSRSIISGYTRELEDEAYRKELEQSDSDVKPGASGVIGRKGGARRRRADQKQNGRSTGSRPSGDAVSNAANEGLRSTGSVKVVSKSPRTSKGHRVPTAADYHREDAEVSSLDAYKRSMRERYEGSSSSETGSLSRENSDVASSTGRISALARDTGSFASIDDATADEGSIRAGAYERRRRGRQRPHSRSAQPEGSGSSRRRYNPANVSQSLPERLVATVTAAFSEKRTRLIIIAVLCVVIALVLLAGVLLGTAGTDDTGIMSVSGGAGEQTLTENGTDKKTGSAVATVTTANGNPVVISVDVPKGKTSLINIVYDDDKAYDGTAVGPWHREFQVTQSFSGTFGTVDAVTVEANGSPVQLSTQEDGSGSLELNVKAEGLAGSN